MTVNFIILKFPSIIIQLLQNKIAGFFNINASLGQTDKITWGFNEGILF